MSRIRELYLAREEGGKDLGRNSLEIFRTKFTGKLLIIYNEERVT